MTIYFIQSRSGAIKIGFTANSPESRLAKLQVGNHEPLKLIASAPGTVSNERELHQRFARHRLKGEWFKAAPSILSLVVHVNAHGDISGWRDGPDLAEQAMLKTNREKSAPEPAAIWELMKEAIASVRPPTQSFPDLVRRNWTPMAVSSERFVEHAIKVRESGFVYGACWVDRDSGMRCVLDPGVRTTAEMLAQADHDVEATAAVWIQAALRDLCGGGETRRDLAMLFPDSVWLQQQAHERFPFSYHHRVSSALPLKLELPEHAVLSVREFIRSLAVLQLATFARYRILAWYSEEWSEPVRKRRAA